jgi:protein SCO1/2
MGCAFARRLALLALCSAALSGNVRADVKPLAARVGVDEHVGSALPLDLVLTDQRGVRRTISEFLQHGRPLLLALAYYHCPGLCDISLRELATRLRDLGWKVGRDYTALTVSIDPHDTAPAAAAKRANVIQLMHLDPSAAGAWPFTAADPATLQRLTQTLGYRYDYDAPTHQYAHPAVSFAITPDGKIARYLYGPTLELGDIRLALREARLGRGGATALIDRTVLSCFQWDAKSHRYELLILGVMRIGAATIALLLALAIWLFARRGRQRRAAPLEEQSEP